MKIQEGKYTLYSDQYSYWITEQKTSKKGQVREERIAGYCTSLEKLFTDFSERVIRSSEAECLEDVLSSLIEAESACEALLKKVLTDGNSIKCKST